MQRRGWAMSEVAIDITGEEGAPSVVNTHCFDLQLTGCGISIDVTHKQAQAIYSGLAEFFGPEEEPTNWLTTYSPRRNAAGTASLIATC